MLGRAGTNQVFRDFTNAPQPNTWYSGALANAISGSDNGSGTDDIQARFNSNIDNNNACLNQTNWFYGIGVDAPSGTISFFDTVKHELGHGLGVQSFVDIVTTGALLQGRNDAYTNMLHDHSSGDTWANMTNAERLASAADTGDLHWLGPRVNQCAQTVLTAGMAGGHVRMYAPSPIEPGSSVSHFDTALTPDELMEPFATDTSDQRLTDRLLADIGWDVNSPFCGTIHIPAISLGGHIAQFSLINHQRPLSIIHRQPLSPGHWPIGSIHRPAGSFHSVIQSPGHNVFVSQGHNVIQSTGHNVLVSQGHGVIQSTGHNLLLSQGHNLVESSGHNSVASRFGGIPIPGGPGGDPFAQGMPPSAEHAVQNSIQHSQIVSWNHNTFLSSGTIHDLPSSIGHLTVVSRHNPIVSNWHSPITSGHNTFVSSHNPVLSGHNPLLSGHNPTSGSLARP